MLNYEVTFIVDPVLSGDEIKATEKTYSDLLKDQGCTIVNVDALGLKQLAYPINKRSSGIYYTLEFNGNAPIAIPTMELALRRDERIMRFLTIKLDKYGIKYNDDKRSGLIGTVKSKKKSDDKKEASKAPVKAKAKAKPADAVAATPAPAPVPAKKEEVKAVEKEDLTKIEGIGPKIAETLNNGDVNTFAALAAMSPEDIRGILDKSDSNFAAHDPATWPQQSKLAADGKWDELKTLQDELDGGKVVKTGEEE